jgi:hypothetical protein
MDTEDLISPHLPGLPAGRICKREELPLFDYLFLPYRQARGVTCLREAASAKARGRFYE